MGVFDYVNCEYPLPGCKDPSAIRFQTKDTDAMFLETYKLTKEGRLLHRDVRYEDQSDPNAETGSMTPVPIGWMDTNFHGDLIFYGGKYEYTALFKDGQLIDVRRIE